MMQLKNSCKYLPRYKGASWVEADLPGQGQVWMPGKQLSVKKDAYHSAAYAQEMHKAIGGEPWKWPKRTLYFISDMHADADAFMASLVASGGVEKTGPRDKDFKLTGAGRKARFIIGGDCFDKGPSTLRLLDVVRRLIDCGADIQLLAGNHDVRMMIGIKSVGMEPNPRTDHFFIRMGPKMVPFLTEIRDRYLQGKDALHGIPDSRECRRQLYPPKSWFREFPQLAVWAMPEKTIESEVQKLRKKMKIFEADCEKAELSIRMVYAAARKWQQLFLSSKGEYAWFYKRMKLGCREGSFIFVHAGIDDRAAKLISEKGMKHINRKFRKQMYRDPFDFYYGSMANIIRTKYRPVDMPLTRHGVKLLRKKSGVHAIVHGHRNLLHGQRIMLRKGMVNFECDTTLDCNSRKKEGLAGQGAAVTIFRPEGLVMGVSTDYPYIKVFEPASINQ
ncbi:MAG: metallophosphoesterase [Gammaproteobacteria bacterium]|nr:metallophosphoesterase [Gammaproteobacteria bacterium]